MPNTVWPSALLLAAIAGASPLAAARERPGTPAHATASLVDPTTIRITWTNTRSIGTSSDGFPDATYFDIQGRTDPSVANFGARPLLGEAVTYDITGLRPGTHCFRLWSRESPNGVRSEVPGAWTCATVPGAQPILIPGNTPNPAIGSIEPIQPHSVWVVPRIYYQGRQPGSTDLGQFHDTGDSMQSSGVVLIAKAADKCPYPWRHVLYQYGSWPGLGGAGFTSGNAAYGLCWFTHVPTKEESVQPPPPQPPPAIGTGGACYHGVNCP